jgi:hypothetical protein
MLLKNQTALLLDTSRAAERRLEEAAPRTPAWRQAQRDVVRGRVEYWDHMRRMWDWNNQEPRRVAATPAQDSRVRQ